MSGRQAEALQDGAAISRCRHMHPPSNGGATDARWLTDDIVNFDKLDHAHAHSSISKNG